jgi:hydrogenase nickel incorporation protein HypA/HybF
MHESSLAKHLLEVILARSIKENARRVTSVQAWVAETETLHPQSIAFHFGAFARGTMAEGATLSLNAIHIEATCDGCRSTYLPEHHLLLCPSCGSTSATLSRRPGVGIDSIQVE